MLLNRLSFNKIDYNTVDVDRKTVVKSIEAYLDNYGDGYPDPTNIHSSFFFYNTFEVSSYKKKETALLLFS